MKRYLTLTLLFALSSVPALANDEYMEQFKSVYPNSPVQNCKVCHDRKPRLNVYGNELVRVGFNYAAIEALDSDGDGVSNIDEINKGTLPGDKASF